MNQPATIQTASLDALCAQLVQAKAAADAARRTVLDLEESIVALVGAKDEGSFSVECDSFKVTTTQPITRTVDKMLARDVFQKLPTDLANGIFDWKPSLNLKLFRELEKYQPEYHKVVAQAVTSKPGKVAVKVVEVSA